MYTYLHRGRPPKLSVYRYLFSKRQKERERKENRQHSSTIVICQVDYALCLHATLYEGYCKYVVYTAANILVIIRSFTYALALVHFSVSICFCVVLLASRSPRRSSGYKSSPCDSTSHYPPNNHYACATREISSHYSATTIYAHFSPPNESLFHDTRGMIR